MTMIMGTMIKSNDGCSRCKRWKMEPLNSHSYKAFLRLIFGKVLLVFYWGRRREGGIKRRFLMSGNLVVHIGH